MTVLAAKSGKCLTCGKPRRQKPTKTNSKFNSAIPSGRAVAKMSIRLQERIRDLEQTLQEERRALAESQQRYDELERKYQDLLLRDLS